MDDKERAQEYRRRAQEAERRAEAARDVEAKRAYRQVADSYIELARIIERNSK